MLYILGFIDFFSKKRYSRDVGFFRMLLSSTSVPLGAIFASGFWNDLFFCCLMRYDMVSYQRRRDGNKRSPLDRWTVQETGLNVSDGK